jgi:hypothetical protein
MTLNEDKELWHGRPSDREDPAPYVSDPRPRRPNRLHKLADVITIAIFAVIAAADGWADVEEYGRAKYAWLKAFLDLPFGIPSHDTFGRVAGAIADADGSAHRGNLRKSDRAARTWSFHARRTYDYSGRMCHRVSGEILAAEISVAVAADPEVRHTRK